LPCGKIIKRRERERGEVRSVRALERKKERKKERKRAYNV
jgi:hypothetical protein